MASEVFFFVRIPVRVCGAHEPGQTRGGQTQAGYSIKNACIDEKILLISG